MVYRHIIRPIKNKRKIKLPIPEEYTATDTIFKWIKKYCMINLTKLLLKAEEGGAIFTLGEHTYHWARR